MAQDKNPILLLITDSPVKGAFFRKHLKEEFHLIHCETEEEAFDHLTSSKISLLIVDEKSYGVSIFKFCEKIRKISKLEEIPLLVITSQLKKSYTRKLLTMGASDFLREPLQEDELHSRIELAKRYHKMHHKMSSIFKSIPIIPKNSTESLNQVALKEVTKAHEKREKISMLMMEVDGFDGIAHHWGQLIGEELLSLLQKDLNKLLRRQDTLISLGSGKYIILLPNTSKTAAKHIAEEIKLSIFEKRYATKQTSLRATVSIGLVTHEEEKMEKISPYQDLDGMLKQVTNYLDEAKKGGNQIIHK